MKRLDVRDSRGRVIDIGDLVVYEEWRWVVEHLWYQPTGRSDEPRHSSKILLKCADENMQMVVKSDSMDHKHITIVDGGDVLREICDVPSRCRLP